MPNVSNLVKTIQDIMRKDAGTYGDAQRLEQLGWMFFLKIFDDREMQLELFQDDYRSPLPKNLRWRNWAADEEGITGDALLDFIDNSLLPKLKSLSGSDKMSTLIRMAFEDANNYMKNGTLMRQVINKVNGIDFNVSDDRHLFGDIYEKLLKDLQSAGNAGEFYTPRAVTQFIVDQVNPRLGETVLDPACGTGGFLVCAIEHLRKQAKTEADERTIQDCFSGIEKKHLPHVLCMTNLMLHGIDVPSNVRHDNTLARPLRDWGPKERVDVIVTNPPFGGIELSGGIPDARDGRFVFGVAHEGAQARRSGRIGFAGRDVVWRGGQNADQGSVVDRVQFAHHRSAAQRRVQSLYGDPHEFAFL
jgi:type I restriction enzyme M protein